MRYMIPIGNVRRGDKVVRLSSRLGVPIIGVIVLVSLVMSSCRGKGESENTDILLSMGDSVLMLSDVVRRIPVGIDPVDSAALFHKIVANWVESMVLTDLAKSKLPDIDKIEAQVDAYRNRLIVTEYLRKVREGKTFVVSEDSVRAFYESHSAEMVTETPLIKGIYIKVAESSGSVDEVKRCIFDATDPSIDELEKKWLAKAIQYDYFVNEWVDWEVIADQIPYRFYDADAFLSSTSNFETSCNGSVYLLHITDFLPSGSLMPLEFASPRIVALLEQAKMASFEKSLVSSLVKKAISRDLLVPGDYDPVEGRYTGNSYRKKKNLKDEK